MGKVILRFSHPFDTLRDGNGDPYLPTDYVRSGAHQTAGLAAVADIERLDASGNPSASGSVGFLGIGMSNARLTYAQYKILYDADPDKAPGRVFINAGEDGATQEAWRVVSNAAWTTTAANAVSGAGLTNLQVQLAWMTMIQKTPVALGTNLTEAGVDEIVTNLLTHYPNVKYLLTSTTGYTYYSAAFPAGSSEATLAPEPYVHDAAILLANMTKNGHTFPGSLYVDHKSVWANGKTVDPLTGLNYLRADIQADGVHPSTSGAIKLATNLYNRTKADVVLADVLWAA